MNKEQEYYRMRVLMGLNETPENKKPLIKEGLSDYLHYGADAISAVLDYTGVGTLPAVAFDIAHAATYFLEARNEINEDKKDELIFAGWITFGFAFLPFLQPFAIGLKASLKGGLKAAKLSEKQLGVLVKLQGSVKELFEVGMKKLDVFLESAIGKKILGKNAEIIKGMMNGSQSSFKEALDILIKNKGSIKRNAETTRQFAKEKLGSEKEEQ